MANNDIVGFLPKGLQTSFIEKKLEEFKKEIVTEIEGESIDRLLVLLLNAMRLLFIINKKYRSNIKDFSGTYVISSQDGKIDVSVTFKKITIFFRKEDGMVVGDKAIPNPTTSITFKDTKAMVDFLLSGNPDVISGMLNNQVSVSGNLNYLFRFVFLIMEIPELLGINDFKQLLAKHK